MPPVTPSLVWLAAALSALVVLIANSRGIATGDDGVGYRAIADSLLAGDGYGYFLEDPVTVWPPVWPGLMALVAWVTPLDTLGAAIVLNAATAAGVVVVGTKLLRSIVDDGRLVLAGTAVLALGPATIGLGHVLMTDLAFALLTMTWMLTLIRFRRTGSIPALVGAAALVWVGFGLRYVGLVLIPFGGLWLLADLRRPFIRRLRDGVLYGVIASLAPIAWMLRNRAIDGTFTGERNPSARGLVDNGFDVAATLGRFLLPGVGNDMTYVWAAVGVVVAGGAGVLAWTVLRVPPDDPDGAPLGPGAVLSRLGHRIGSPLGLVVGFAVGYLVYMLYVRTTTALNQLDLRLLFPAYFPLLVGALALIERLDRPPARFSRLGHLTVRTWVAANVVAGLVGAAAFAAGNPYFEGNYESEVFVDARANPALDALEDDCRTFSNLPNGLYPEVESLWSPQRRALESSRELDELDELAPTFADDPACLVWIDAPPVYGHLWPLDELERRLELELLAEDGQVAVYRMSERT